MKRTQILLAVVCLALGAGAVWLLLPRGAGSGRGTEPASATHGAPDTRSDAELAAPAGVPATRGEPAPGDREAVAAAASPTSAVVIQDVRGAPVAGVKWAVFRGADVLASGTTEADGVATVARIASASKLAAVAPGRPPQVFALEPPLERQVVRLSAGAAVAGRVLVEGFPPREPLELKFTSDRELFPADALPETVWKALDQPAQAVKRLATTTSRAGGFRFHSLPADSAGTLSWPLRLKLAEPPDGASKAHNSLPVVPPVEDLVLRLVPAPQITGQVVLPDTGEPIPRARVAGSWNHGQFFMKSSATADDDGRFAFVVDDGLPAHAMLTVADGERGGAQLYEFDIPTGLTLFDTGPLAILPVRTVAFRVRDAAGAPIEDAGAKEVAAAEGGRAEAMTDAEGRGTLRVAHDARALRVSAVGYEPVEAQIPAGDKPMEIILQPGTVLEVRLVPAAADVGLQLGGKEPPFFSDGEPSWYPEPMRLKTFGFGGETFAFQLPKDGIFVLTCVRPGLPLTVGVIDGQGIAVLEQAVEPLAAGERRVVELALPLERFTLAGSVRSEDGAPLPDARVLVGAVDGQTGRSSATDGEGRFRIQGLAVGRVRLVVTHAQYAPLLVADQAVVEEPPLELVLERGRLVRVAVHGPTGQPVPGATALLEAGDPPWSPPAPVPTPEGFAFEHAPSDPLALTVTAGGRRFERAVAAGSGPAQVDVEVPAWQSCTVRFENTALLPPDRHLSAHLTLTGREQHQGRSDEGKGEVRFDVVFPGRYEVYAGAWSVSHELERWSETKTIEVTPDAPASVTLKLRAP